MYPFLASTLGRPGWRLATLVVKQCIDRTGELHFQNHRFGEARGLWKFR